MFSLSIISP